jgi:predicted NUDIX family NTP pyrophosphohydrolase
VPKLSAGVLVYRARDGVVEVLIAHPGGPFWARKDDGAWSIPKGEYADGEDPWAAAQREFFEELALPVPPGPRIDLGSLKQPSGKVVNTFEMEWPRGSGKMREFPEIDRVGWFAVAQARTKLLKGQRAFLDRLMTDPALEGLREGT